MVVPSKNDTNKQPGSVEPQFKLESASYRKTAQMDPAWWSFGWCSFKPIQKWWLPWRVPLTPKQNCVFSGGFLEDPAGFSWWFPWCFPWWFPCRPSENPKPKPSGRGDQAVRGGGLLRARGLPHLAVQKARNQRSKELGLSLEAK